MPSLLFSFFSFFKDNEILENKTLFQCHFGEVTNSYYLLNRKAFKTRLKAYMHNLRTEKKQRAAVSGPRASSESHKAQQHPTMSGMAGKPYLPA